MSLSETFTCPLLFLAPMEGVGDRPFRRAMASVGGFDWACTEFIRVPLNAHILSLSKEYDPNDTAPIRQAAQIMGSVPESMGEMARALEARGAPRIDLNCGCPSNTVTGKGAGSSLLKTPELLYSIAKSMVGSVRVPVTAKLRSGYSDTTLFKENVLAAQEAGVAFMTIHPRTKEDGYGPPAKWEYIAEAKRLVKIPVIGNGDILKVEDAVRMLGETGCDGLMIGRGAIMNPWLFQEIQAHFKGQIFHKPPKAFEGYLRKFLAEMDPDVPIRTRINKLKQLLNFMFRASESLAAHRSAVLSHPYSIEEEVLQFALPYLDASPNKSF